MSSLDKVYILDMNLSSLTVVLLPIFQFLRKGNILLPDDSAIALLGIYPEELKTCPHKTCA